MPVLNNYEFKMDCVYNPEGASNEFRNAHVKMEIENDGLVLTILTDGKVNKSEIESVLAILQKDRLRKMRLDLARDCRIFVIDGDVKRKVITDGQTVSRLE